MRLSKFVISFSLVTGLVTSLSIKYEVVYGQEIRQVVTVSSKKHIQAEHVVGLDTYNKPVDFFIKEKYILRFKDMAGHFVITKELYENTTVGRKFVVFDNNLYFCQDIDPCDSFE